MFSYSVKTHSKMNRLIRNALQRARFFAQRAGYTINRTEAFAFPDQKELLKRRDVRTIFDVGANNGSTVEQYRRIFPDATVYCFEPIPALAERIRGRFAQDERVRVFPVALAEAQGHRQFNVNENIDTSSLLGSAPGIPSAYQSIQKAVQVIEVESATIDSACASGAISQIDILKMDIQGGELLALRGASGMLARASIQLIYTEVWFLPFYEQQALFGELCRFLAGFDYTLHAIYNAGFSGSTGRMTWADAIFVSPELKSHSFDTLKSKHGA